MADEFRVEVELDDSEHGYTLGERLRAVDLDEDARRRLGPGVMVTRDGSRLFAYASSEEEARAAERAIRWDDPSLAIAWPELGAAFTLSDKDRAASTLDGAELFA